MDLNEIMVFIQVIKSGSFTQAARALGMPNSTVSSKVSSLETRLGTTLIQRTTRKLNITPAGEAYFKKCIHGLEEIEAAETELAATQGEPQGLLRITAPVELGNSVLPELISKFTVKYPKVILEFLLTDRRVDLIGESFDLAIRAGELKDSSLIAKKIGSSYFVLVASPKYLKTRGSPKHPRELHLHNCLHFTPLGTEYWRLRGPKGALNVPVSNRVIVNDFATLKSIAVLGEGIAFLPLSFCLGELNSGKLLRVLGEWRSETATIHFVYPGHRFVSPKLSAFMEMAMAALRRSFEDVGGS